jgi:hypothetical protein
MPSKNRFKTNGSTAPAAASTNVHALIATTVRRKGAANLNARHNRPERALPEFGFSCPAAAITAQHNAPGKFRTPRRRF